MSVRLTVVISQTRQGSSRQQSLEAGLITELIGRPGIDVSVIGSLDNAAQSATDQLVLEGISGDFAIVAWQSADEIMQQLTELQIPGRRSIHPADSDFGGDVPVGGKPGRRIYCFDTNGFENADQLVDALARLLEERRVVTVSLAPPELNASIESSGSGTGLPVVGNARRNGDDSRSTPPTATPTPAPSKSDGQATPSAGRNQPADEDQDERERLADARLDALVDDLNTLDL